MARVSLHGMMLAAFAALLTAFGCEGGRVSSNTKGSLLIYSKVEIRWDRNGNVIQDTILDLTNDYPEDVDVQLYLINGDAPVDEILAGDPPLPVVEGEPGWNWVDCQIHLTANQPTFWSALEGVPGGGCPFDVLDPARVKGPGRPDSHDIDGGRVLRGYVLAWAVDRYGCQIRWNHLKGDAVIINYRDTTAWEYKAWAFQANTLLIDHAEPAGFCGALMPGVFYDAPYDQLLLDFYATGSTALSGGGSSVMLDTDLTLFPVAADLRQDSFGPITTKAKFDIWNENEVRFSGAERCITCWDQTFLGDYDAPNHFLIRNLQTDKGKARIDGVESDRCETNPGACDLFRECVKESVIGMTLESMDSSIEGTIDGCRKVIEAEFDVDDLVCSADAALLGVSAKHLTFSGGSTGREVAGMNISGMGHSLGLILYDSIVSPPDELRDGGVRTAGSPSGTKGGGRGTRSTPHRADLGEVPAE